MLLRTHAAAGRNAQTVRADTTLERIQHFVTDAEPAGAPREALIVADRQVTVC